MAIERRSRRGGTRTVVRIVECPFCGAPIGKDQAWPNHWIAHCPENDGR